MRKALPVITEAVETLKQRLQHERDGRKKPPLQMLYLLASGQAQKRRSVPTCSWESRSRPSMPTWRKSIRRRWRWTGPTGLWPAAAGRYRLL
jgi:hypothetical protein